MDPFHHPHWRPPHQQICPLCFHPHFPFCPSLPPPFHPYRNPHPYYHHPSPHFPPPLPLDPPIAHKRPRVEPLPFLDDQRHLKLIQDPGFPISNTVRFYPQTLDHSPSVSSKSQSTVISASRIFTHPYRNSRPDRIVIILRGLPGSGKSYTAKLMRELELKNGFDAPRIHSIDDYFLTEVEKGGRKSKSLEYCYEPDMEGAYRESMLKAFKKTIGDGGFKFVIVDDCNLRVADFAQFWVSAKGLGYEVYISEAAYKDPAGCAARNIHGFSFDEIKKMADEWEEAPSLYLKLDNKDLFHNDELREDSIQEVEMDAEDDDASKLTDSVNESDPSVPFQSVKASRSSEDENDEGVKELGKSKWSDYTNEERPRAVAKNNCNAFSGLIQTNGKKEKSVRWNDQAAYSGFLIGAAKKASSLVIGPGAGYNLKSNPLLSDEAEGSNRGPRNDAFEEQLRAERVTFRSVFEKRRHRIAGFVAGDEE